MFTEHAKQRVSERLNLEVDKRLERALIRNIKKKNKCYYLGPSSSNAAASAYIAWIKNIKVVVIFDDASNRVITIFLAK